MSFNEKLLLGIFIGIITFLVTNIILFILKRMRVRAALLSDISYHIIELREIINFLDKLFEFDIVENKIISYSAYYTKDEFDFYKSLQKDLMIYFGKNNILKIIKFYKSIWEVHVLMEGFMNDLTKWQGEKRVLTKNDIAWLKRKKERIVRLITVLTTKDINKLMDLPEDYRGRIEPSTLISDK